MCTKHVVSGTAYSCHNDDIGVTQCVQLNHLSKIASKCTVNFIVVAKTDDYIQMCIHETNYSRPSTIKPTPLPEGSLKRAHCSTTGPPAMVNRK